MRPRSKSLTVQAALALAVFAVVSPFLAKVGVELDDETRQAIILLIGAAIAYGMRRAQGGLS